ncbi:probable prefoldin subunit 4 [Atheta coriaria]|uniref:probable prefoldin subunit 4 n=1 Tax=Dalotia coriaria TaxID=877792 RepID=UPI0031F439EC
MSNMGTFQPESDVHITFEDQQKINKFARLNAKLEDIKEELKIKENDMKNFEEASEEIELLDDEENIPYLVGEVFVYQNLEKTKACLEEDKKAIQVEMDQLKEESNKTREIMSDLKSHLYGRFGSHINLEPDE